MTPKPPLDDDELSRRLGASAAMQDAPEGVIERAIQAFARRATALPGAAPRRAGLVPRLASLAFDSGLGGPLAFGRRGTAGAVRQMLFTLEGHDIDLRIGESLVDAGLVISGQVLGPESAGQVVLESVDDGATETTPLSELGEFRLSRIRPGVYRLTLELTDRAIELPPLQVAPAEGQA